MAEDEGAPDTLNPAGNGGDTLPQVGILAQYVKDLSFENPNAPAIYQVQAAPQIDIQFNIGTGQVGEDVHEVILRVEVRAEIEGQVAFLVDLAFAGLFGLRNIPAEHLQPFLLAEAPRLLFPFARRVLADAVRDGGFQPLLLEPIDFGAIYLQQAEAQGVTTAETGTA